MNQTKFVNEIGTRFDRFLNYSKVNRIKSCTREGKLVTTGKKGIGGRNVIDSPQSTRRILLYSWTDYEYTLQNTCRTLDTGLGFHRALDFIVQISIHKKKKYRRTICSNFLNFLKFSFPRETYVETDF